MRIEEWNEDSILSRAGYRADGTQSRDNRMMCINRAVAGRQENALEVLRHLRWLKDDRGNRYPRAQRIWQEDLEYICRVINGGLQGDASTVEQQVTQLRNHQEARVYRTRDIFGGLKRQV